MDISNLPRFSVHPIWCLDGDLLQLKDPLRPTEDVSDAGSGWRSDGSLGRSWYSLVAAFSTPPTENGHGETPKHGLTGFIRILFRCFSMATRRVSNIDSRGANHFLNGMIEASDL